MARKAGTGLVVALSGLLIGCGGGDGPKSNDRSQNTPAEGGISNENAGGWTGPQANTYDTARIVCGEPSPSRVAKELGLPASSDAPTIAEEYAKGSTEEHRQPAFEGCLDGLGAGG
jgi:hypothetical protein